MFTTIKSYLGIAVSAILAVFYMAFKFRGHKIEQLHETVESQEVQNAQLVEAVEVAKEQANVQAEVNTIRTRVGDSHIDDTRHWMRQRAARESGGEGK